MKNYIVLLTISVSCALTPADARVYRDEHIRYEAVNLSERDREILRASIEPLHRKYDPQEKMITKELTGYNYHTDAETGTYHEVRASLNYAVNLLDLGDPQYQQRAFDLIRRTIQLQDTVSASKTCGIWPYYLEEPLATKKSAPDFNWADFNGVSLLDVYMGHHEKLPEALKATIRTSLIYAARSIKKRDVQPGYTNIAIMGTYVTYLVSHLFDIEDIREYATNRLDKFYQYTKKNGFTEYNSPTYTIVALDELDRMKRHIVDKDAKPKIEALYHTGWEIIAKHYHKPTGEWAGPHSRSYRTLLAPSVHGILREASGGKINPLNATQRADVKIRHQIPDDLLPYFLSPKYPRTETDILASSEPRITGTSYLTESYALSTANRSSLWNQRRPFLLYWGTHEHPSYLQIRMLHDDYDFSSSAFYSQQQENDVLAAVNFMTLAGDKHINLDRMKDTRFKAKDLRLRFEFGNLSENQLVLPAAANAPFTVELGGLRLDMHLFRSAFGDEKGKWEKGSNGDVAWLDFVIYKGAEKDFDFGALQQAVLAFTFSVGQPGKNQKAEKPKETITGSQLEATWKDLKINVNTKPEPQPKQL